LNKSIKKEEWNKRKKIVFESLNGMLVLSISGYLYQQPAKRKS